MSDIYAELLLESAKHPEHYKLLDDFTATAEGFNASCGDKIQVTLKVTNEIITDVGWIGQGCVISRAHMSVLSELMIGKKISEILKMEKKDLLQFFGFDETLSPGRDKCLLIGLNTVKLALK
jgi:nitrogen fixation NifU-like protein